MLKRYIDKTMTGINAAAASVAIANAPAIEVKNARHILAQFTRASHTAGSGLFEIYGSIDGVNFSALPLVSLIANTNAQTLTRVLSVSLASNTNVLYQVAEEAMGVRYVKGQYTKTTDGTGTLEMTVEDELTS